MKILIADDEPTSLMMMGRMLRQSGYEVSTACNGTEVVEEVLDANGPRLLLLDWMMPELSGPEVCQAIRTEARNSYVYIILLTARDTKDDLVRGLEAGADDYLTKPCHPDELRARLRTGQRVLHLEDRLIEARNQMQTRATYDALTSLLNRGAILERLAARVSHPPPQPCAVILCDVDHFKSVNDTHGHPVGDEVLREVAQRLQRLAGNADAAGRYGGEEFLLVLDHCAQDHVQQRAEEVCAAIRSTPIQTSAGPLSITISAGGMTIDHTATSANQVLQQVDLLLYQAKRAGRNRAVVPGSWHEAEIDLADLAGIA